MERADQHRDNAPAHSTAFVQVFLAQCHVTQVRQPPYSTDMAPCVFWLYPKLKIAVEWEEIVNATLTQYTSSVIGISLLSC
jgi:hypothetical protein